MTPSIPASPPARSLHSHLSKRQWLGLILLGHLLLALLYSMMIPPWEAHDEWAHFRYAAYVAETRSLPDPGQRLTTEFEFDEASQPPLYYLLAAAPMLAVDTADGYTPQINPYISGENAQTGLNVAVHDPAIEGFPWRGTILALYLGRFISIIISLLALLVTFQLIHYLSPHRPEIALIGTAIQAFAPQFIFLSAVITNDILVILLEPLLLLLSLRLIEEGPRPRLTLYVSLVAGLAILTKYLALAVVPLALIAFVWGAWRHRRDGRVARQISLSFLVFVGVMLLSVGGWLGRNFQLTGVWIPRDPVSQRSLITGLQDGGLNIDWTLLPMALRSGFQTYWASFGWGNLSPARWVYGVWATLILAGLIGLALWLRTSEAARARRLLVFLALFIFAAVSFPLMRELLHDSAYLRGRYLLATLPLAAWTLAQGWTHLARRYWQWTAAGLALWPAGLSLALLFLLLMSAYTPPPVLADAPDLPIPLHARFGDAAELLSADIWPKDEAHVNQGLAVTLTWRVLAPTDVPYTLVIQLVGAGGQVYGSLHTYPGHGNAATNVWQPGVFQETYWLTVQPELPLPASGHLLVTLFNPDADPATLPIYDSQGNHAGDSLHFGSLRISPDENLPAPPLIEAPKAIFEGALLLKDAVILPEPQHPGGIFPVWLRWQALGPGPDDLTLSLQLLDQNGAWITGIDGDVSDILLPQHWRQGDHLDTARWFSLPPDIPPGRYKLVAALYRSGDLSRIPATDASGNPLSNNAYPLGEITIH